MAMVVQPGLLRTLVGSLIVSLVAASILLFVLGPPTSAPVLDLGGSRVHAAGRDVPGDVTPDGR